MLGMPTPTPSVDVAFRAAAYPPEAFSYQVAMTKFGLTKAAAKRAVAELKQHRVLLSSTHQVARMTQTFGGATVAWLTCKRLDRAPILDRRELGQIAEALLPGTVALELLPAPDRLVDVANQFHIFGLSYDDFQPFLGDQVERVQPPHLGCWRDLYRWKEASYPGREAALILTGPPELAERVLVAPLCMRFPFGFATGAVSADSRGGVIQRPFGP